MTAEPRRILVIQLRRIGDVLLTTAALAALRRRHPDAEIDFLVEPPGAQALEGNPDLTRVLVYQGADLRGALGWMLELRRRRYDLVIDFLGNPRSALLAFASGAPRRAGPAHVFHRWAYTDLMVQSPRTRYAGLEKALWLEALGVEAAGLDPRPRLFLAERPARPENLVALIPASRRETRRWPAASYAALGRLLHERFGCRLLVLWGPGERALAEEVARGVGPAAEVSPETKGLKDLARQLARCRLAVTNCNGPKHVAVGLGVPTVTVHGSSDPEAWNPPHASHRVVRRDELSCIGCRSNSCPYALECLAGLAPERVFAAAAELLESEAGVR